jgi:hypothetical protein
MGDVNRWAKSYGGEERLRRNIVRYRCGDLTIPILDWLTPRLFDSTTSFARLRYPIRDWARKHIATQNPGLPSWAVDHLVSDTSQLPIRPLPGKVWKTIQSHGELDMDIPFQPLGGPVRHVKLKGHLSGPVSQPTVQVGLYSWKGKTPVEIDHWEGKIKSIGDKCFIEGPRPGAPPNQTPGGAPLKHQFLSGRPGSVGMTGQGSGFGSGLLSGSSLSNLGAGLFDDSWGARFGSRSPAGLSGSKSLLLGDSSLRDIGSKIGLAGLRQDAWHSPWRGPSSGLSLGSSGGGFLSNLWNAGTSFSSASTNLPSIRLSTSPSLTSGNWGSPFNLGANPLAWQGAGSLSGGPSLSSFARGL